MASPIPTTDLTKLPDLSTKPTIIPWKCLVDSDSPSIAPKSNNQNTSITPKSNNQNTTKAPKTFAQALANVCDTLYCQLPKPTLKGDKFSIEILDDEYELGLDACKNNLHARVIWPKDSTPLTVVALREKLNQFGRT